MTSQIHVRLKSFLASLAVIGLLLFGSVPFLTPAYAFAADSISVWWPTSGAHVAGSGAQPFKALDNNLDVSQYDMYWRVDGGQWNYMPSNYTAYPHKETSVDMTGWTWHGNGPYVIDFVARKNGADIAQTSVNLYVDNGSSASTPAPAPAPAPVQVTPPAPGTTATASAPSAPAFSPSDPDPVHALIAQGIDPDPVHQAQKAVQMQTQTVSNPAPAPVSTGVRAPTITPVPVQTQTQAVQSAFYVDQNSDAARQAQAWQSSNPSGAAAMKTLAAEPTAVWFGDWNSNVQSDVSTLASKAQAAGQIPVMVAYDIPERDCGGFSAGGTNNPQGYESWINSFAAGLGSSKAYVILEPDALAQIDCLGSADQNTRLSLLSYAVAKLTQDPNAKVYLDAGHSDWVDPATMARRLVSANIAAADGFALNVSNFMPTGGEVTYGTQISANLGGKHFIVDTARNGNGSDGQWCNPPGRAIGQDPTTNTGNPLVDAFLWLKVPGESDGSCNGGPSAGTWWPEYALELVQNAHR